MNEEEKIDRFFKSRLQDLNSEDNWNVPSEEVWEKASPFFPKRKKRWRILFFFWGLGIVTLSATGVYFASAWLETSTGGDMVVSDATLISEEELSMDSKDSKPNQDIHDKHLKEGGVNLEHTESQSQLSSASRLDRRNTKTDMTKMDLFDSIVNQENSTEQIEQNAIASSVKSTVYYEQSFVPNDHKSSDGIQSADLPVPILNADQVELAASDIPKMPDRIEGSTSSENEETSSEKFVLNALPGLSFGPFDIPDYNITGPGIIPIKNNIPNEYYKKRWHVGLSTERFINNPFTTAEFEGENDIHTKYRTGLLSISKFLGPKVTIQSGFQYLNARVDIDLQFEDTYDAIMPSESVSRSIVDNSSIGILSLDGQESTISIEWADNAVIEDGDLIRFNVGLPLRLQYYSFPIYFNYYFVRNRIGFSLLWGASIDVFKLDIDGIDVELLNESGTRLNSGASIDPLSISDTTFSVYTGVGLEYNLSEEWFISTQFRLDLLGPEYSRIGLGLHRRF